MTIGRYDTDAMREHANRLDAAADTLRGVAGDLGRLVDASLPPLVAVAVADLGRRGRDMTGDIADGARSLGDGLSRAAGCYDDLERSVVSSLSAT